MPLARVRAWRGSGVRTEWFGECPSWTERNHSQPGSLCPESKGAERTGEPPARRARPAVRAGEAAEARNSRGRPGSAVLGMAAAVEVGPCGLGGPYPGKAAGMGARRGCRIGAREGRLGWVSGRRLGRVSGRGCRPGVHGRGTTGAGSRVADRGLLFVDFWVGSLEDAGRGSAIVRRCDSPLRCFGRARFGYGGWARTHRRCLPVGRSEREAARAWIR